MANASRKESLAKGHCKNILRKHKAGSVASCVFNVLRQIWSRYRCTSRITFVIPYEADGRRCNGQKWPFVKPQSNFAWWHRWRRLRNILQKGKWQEKYEWVGTECEKQFRQLKRAFATIRTVVSCSLPISLGLVLAIIVTAMAFATQKW